MESLSFDKSLRLLSSSDYKTVFDNARFKVSSPEVLFLATPSNKPYPRLGLVIAKKNAKLAVQRNRIKRIARESFRIQQHALGGVDTVILARKGLDQLDNQAMHQLFSSLWSQLQRRADKFQQSKSVKQGHATP